MQNSNDHRKQLPAGVKEVSAGGRESPLHTIQDIAYVRYAAPDLDRMEAFLTDFGLHRVQRTERALYMRGAGEVPFVHVTELAPAPATLGFGLLARNAAALKEIARRFGAEEEENPEPGGGRRVRLRDPSGFMVDILHRQQPARPLPMRAPIDVNPASGRRRIGRTVRVSPQPSHVVRLGHVALNASNFKVSFDFYSKLGFRTSDQYYAGAPENIVAAFMHCSLGEQYTDHHTIAVLASQDGSSRLDHAGFEVIDLDDVVQGKAYLESRGHIHSWGVGRHVQGSQIFDYWRDPFGHKVEHWTDGDQVNDHMSVGLAPLDEHALSQWAPPLNPEFFR
jgi:catechol 2,3-dioxygenase-like lactoylglutathione lyase family enzyme